MMIVCPLFLLLTRVPTSLQKKQLLNLDVPALFIQVALDEGPGLLIRYQYPELGKLHAVVSCLIRSCDVSSRWQSSAVSVWNTRLKALYLSRFKGCYYNPNPNHTLILTLILALNCDS